MFLPRLLLLFALFAPATFAQTTVWVIDDDGGMGVDFTNIQSGVDAAADGDVLLVKSGTYDGFTINAKALTVQAEVGATVQVSEGAPGAVDAVEVRNLSAAQVVTIRGLLLQTQDHRGFRFLDCQGTLWIEDCEVVRTDSTMDGLNAEGLRVNNCNSLVLVGSHLRGSQGHPYLSVQRAGHGLHAVDSEVHAFGCTFEGGKGGVNLMGSLEYALDGGDGIRTFRSFCFFSDCVTSGGDGGVAFDSDFGICVDAGDGGHGAALTLSSEAHAIDSTASGGDGGAIGCPNGLEGKPVFLSGGSSFDMFWNESVGCTSSAAVREGGTVVFDVTGPERAPVWLAIGITPTGLYSPTMHGPYLVAPPYAHLASGILDAAGTAQWSYPIPPNFVLGADAFHLYSQAAALDATCGFFLGEGTATVLLDSAF